MNKILLCKTDDLEIGDVILRQNGDRETVTEGHRLLGRTTQGYYSNRVVGGKKYDAFMQGVGNVVWSSAWRANLWKGGIS